NGTELNHDGVHLPVAITQTNVKQRLGDSQMGRGANRQELRKPFNNSQHNRKQVVVQRPSARQRNKKLTTYENTKAEKGTTESTGRDKYLRGQQGRGLI